MYLLFIFKVISYKKYTILVRTILFLLYIHPGPPEALLQVVPPPGLLGIYTKHTLLLGKRRTSFHVSRPEKTTLSRIFLYHAWFLTVI